MELYYIVQISSSNNYKSKEKAEIYMPDIKKDLCSIIGNYDTITYMTYIRSDFNIKGCDITIYYKFKNRIDVDYLLNIINEIKQKNNMENLRVNISENYE